MVNQKTFKTQEEMLDKYIGKDRRCNSKHKEDSSFVKK